MSLIIMKAVCFMMSLSSILNAQTKRYKMKAAEKCTIATVFKILTSMHTEGNVQRIVRLLCNRRSFRIIFTFQRRSVPFNSHHNRHFNESPTFYSWCISESPQLFNFYYFICFLLSIFGGYLR